MLLDENVQSVKLCLSTIIRDLRSNKQKTIKLSPFEAHLGRLPKTEFKILRDKFLNGSGRLRTFGKIGVNSFAVEKTHRPIEG